MDGQTGFSPGAEYQLETFMTNSDLHSDSSYPLEDIDVNRSGSVRELPEHGPNAVANGHASVSMISNDVNIDRPHAYSVTGRRTSRLDGPELGVDQSQEEDERGDQGQSSFQTQAGLVREAGGGSRPWVMGQGRQETGTTLEYAADLGGDQETSLLTHEPHVERAAVSARHSAESERDGRCKKGLRPNFEYDPIESSEAVATGHTPLNYKPIQLRTWFLVVTTIFFLACIGSIIAINKWASTKGGILHVNTTQDHYAFRYAPIAIGSVTSIWWRAIFTTYGRMSPYLSMSAHPRKWNEGEAHERRTIRLLHAYYADEMFEPVLQDIPKLISNGKWLLAVCTFVSLMIALFLLPLKAAFIQVTPDHSGWDIAVSNKIGHLLVSMYAMLSIVTSLIAIKLYHRDTGLKWDPVSLADQLALVQGSNFVSLFAGLETCSHSDYVRQLRERAPKAGSLRLGYWKHRQNGTIWHGLAFVSGTSTDGEDVELSAQHETRERPKKYLPDASPSPLLFPSDSGRADVSDQDLASIRYRGVGFFLYDFSLLMFALLAVIGLAFVIAGLSNRHLRNGIQIVSANIELQSNSSISDTILGGYSGSYVFNPGETILFRMLPVFMMNYFGILWYNADHFYRYMQPFAGMSIPAPATENILLDYATDMPIGITIKAATRGHWRVALFSLLSLTSTIPPIIVSGIFVGTIDTTGVVVRLNPLNFWATFSVLLVCCLSIGYARPTTAYRLPSCIWNIANLTLFCYQSRILDDEILETPVFSANDPLEERIHLQSRIHLAKQNYVFGLYMGKDGKRHLGFDVAERHGPLGQEESVEVFRPGLGLYLWEGAGTFYFRNPRIDRQFD